jgi:hypothetical protein
MFRPAGTACESLACLGETSWNGTSIALFGAPSVGALVRLGRKR